MGGPFLGAAENSGSSPAGKRNLSFCGIRGSPPAPSPSKSVAGAGIHASSCFSALRMASGDSRSSATGSKAMPGLRG